MEKDAPSPLTPAVLSDLFNDRKPHQVFDLLNTYYPANSAIYKHGGLKNLRTMYDNDDEITAAIDTRHESCVSTPWTLEGGDDAERELLWEFIQPFVRDIVSYAWWAVPYGYSVIQVVYDEDFYIQTGLIRPQCIIDEAFDEFRPLRDGRLAHNKYVNRVNEDDAVENPQKYIHVVRNPSYYSPQGEALFTRLYYAWIYRCHGWQYFMDYMETWSKPFMHATTTGSKDTLKALNELLTAEKRPTAITTDEKTKLDVKGAGANNGDIFELMNRGTSERIQRLILGQTLTSGASTSGSQALGNVHNEVRMDKRRADCRLVGQAVQKLVNYLHAMNEMTGDIPLFKMEDPQGLDRERAERDAILTQQVGVNFTKKYIVERFDLEEDDFEIAQQDVIPDANVFGDHSHDLFKFMSAEGLNQRQKASFDLETDAIKEVGDLLDVDEMQALIRTSKTKADLEKNLQAFIVREDPKFMDVFERAIYLSQLKGYVDGKEKANG